MLPKMVIKKTHLSEEKILGVKMMNEKFIGYINRDDPPSISELLIFINLTNEYCNGDPNGRVTSLIHFKEITSDLYHSDFTDAILKAI